MLVKEYIDRFNPLYLKLYVTGKIETYVLYYSAETYYQIGNFLLDRQVYKFDYNPLSLKLTVHIVV